MSEVDLARLYAPTVVLLVWAVAWQSGCRGDGVIAVGLLALIVALGVHVYEELRRYR